jgi:hypothetical protein
MSRLGMIGLAGVFAMSTAAFAADLPPAPVVYDWTGAYVGVNAGAA